LTDNTQTVTNTFTTSDIEVTLAESTGDTYKMIPGYDISKDPKVTVETGSEKCYLFVELKESANFDSYLEYEMATGWEALSGVADVYVRIIETTEMGTAISVLADDKVTVKGSVTKQMMEEAETTKPTLSVIAYASQYMKNATENFTAAEAWANISNPAGN